METTNRVTELKTIEHSLTDTELVYIIGNRLARIPGFCLALTALSHAGSTGWDRGHDVGAVDGWNKGWDDATNPAFKVSAEVAGELAAKLVAGSPTE